MVALRSRRNPLLRRDLALPYYIKLYSGLKPHRFGQTPVFFILSFCRSVKESIKESAFGRRQDLPAGTGAAPLCQPLKFSADYRDVTAALKMKHSRRFRGERFTFFAVAVAYSLRRRREHGLGRALSMPPHSNSLAQLHNGNRRVGCIPDEKIFSKCPPRHVGVFPFFYFEEIKERISQGCEGFSPRNLRRLRWFLREISQNFIF